jgi:DNA-binding MarR family transcriptional regulator
MHMIEMQPLRMDGCMIFPGKDLLPGNNAMYQLSNSLPYLLARLGVRMGDLFTRVIRKEKLTLPMYRVLAALSEERRPLRLGEIVARTSVDQSTLSRLVAEMERSGWLTRERPQDNQRSLQIALTPRGAELASRLMPIAAYYEEVVADTLSARETTALKALLVQLYGNLDRLERQVESGTVRVPPPQPAREAAGDLPAAKPKEKRPHKIAKKRG